MNRLPGLIYGAVAYSAFLCAFVYLVGFVGDIGVPKSINVGGEVDGLFALAINLTLIALFGLQHSLMARSGFKRWLAEFLPASAERATFVLATSVVLTMLFVLWQPIPADIWVLDGLPGSLLSVGFWSGWLLVVAASFLTGHFEFAGLKQSWLAFRQRRSRSMPFVVHSLYRFVRHPMYVGLLAGFWLTPRMTVGHLLFAAGMTGYVLVGMRLEERDLVRQFGRRYRAYRRRVPALVPHPGASVRVPPSTMAHDDATGRSL